MKRWLPILMLIGFLGGALRAQDEISEQRLALRKLVERADSGDAKALYDMARLHETGFDSIPVDSIRSRALYLLSAEKGYAPARNYIGFSYFRGEGIREDKDSALYWIRLAADEGDITAAANLGYLLTEGRGVVHDKDEAVKWLGIASEGGVTGAQIKLVELKEDDWKDMPVDTLMSMGIRYYIGKSPVVGARMLEIAAEKGNPKAMAIMGDAYSKGIGVPYDHKKSIDYFFKGAEGGNPSAQFIVAELLEFFPDEIRTQIPSDSNSGNGSEKGPQFWYELAKDAGITDSEKAYESLFKFP